MRILASGFRVINPLFEGVVTETATGYYIYCWHFSCNIEVAESLVS